MSTLNEGLFFAAMKENILSDIGEAA